MPGERSGTVVDRPLDAWLREEADVRAPDRVIEAVFAKTEASRQLGRGRLGWLRQKAGASGRRPRAILAFGLVALAGAGLGIGLVGSPTRPTPSAPPASGQLSLVGEWSTCSTAPRLALLSDAAGAPGGSFASAWALCGSEAREVRAGSPDAVARQELGAVAGSDGSPWAIRGNSVVQLGPDRTTTRTVRIGTPGALAVDMMYGPAALPFLAWARAHGAVGRDGLGMLVEQAAEAFLFWRGIRPRTADVLAALRRRVDAT